MHRGEARFIGEAVWKNDSLGLTYHEAGTLMTPYGEFAAKRQYQWRPGLKVYFPDGRFFHQVPLDGAEAVHHCDPDLYRVSYDFADWPNFTTTWHVTGPRKDYDMSSAYWRAE